MLEVDRDYGFQAELWSSSSFMLASYSVLVSALPTSFSSPTLNHLQRRKLPSPLVY